MLPVVDMSGLSSADPADRQAVAAAMRAACLAHGFFYLTGHGVPQAMAEGVLAQARDFFALPETEKLRSDKAASAANRGYERLGGQTLEAGAAPDLKEGFYIGRHMDADDPRVLAGGFNQGPNVWPERPAGLRPVMEAYHAAMTAVAERLMGGLALSLGLPQEHFGDFCREPIAILRLLHYPPQPPRTATGSGAGAHTDFGGLTLLLQDDRGGLEVRDGAADGWIAAEPMAGAYVVNLGDLIARWTNGRYRSTLHRVTNRSGAERYSAPFFYSGAALHRIACLDVCLEPGEAPAWPATTVEDHLRACYRRTYAPA